jgi:hypothetical protein
MSRQLKHSDVAFMYSTDKEVYKAYKATWVAWGGASADAVKNAHEVGIHYAASMWALTAGAENIHRRSDLQDAVSKDILLEPIIVPWLWDHTYEGTPSYFGCTNNPVFKEFTRERVISAMETGADGLHIDDHLGSAGSFWSGGCFCDFCIDGFREFLADYLDEVEKLNISLSDFNYREFLKKLVSTREEYQKHRNELPLTELYQTYQVKSAAKFILELRKLAEKTKGGEITCSANTGVPNPTHLVVTPHLTHCVCEVEYRHDNKNAPDASPISAFKVADAIGKPIMATASGWNWAYAHAHNNAVGLVRLWIAESYALGHRLMAPHRKWAFTTELGTHWYQSKPEDFAYLYHFIRDNSNLFDDYEPFSQIALVFCNRSIRHRGLGLFQESCRHLADRNLCFSAIVAGDDWIEDRLKTDTLNKFDEIIVPEPSELTETQIKALKLWETTKGRKVHYIKSVSDLNTISFDSPIEVKGCRNVWVLPRIKPNAPLVCHILNRNYNEADDSVEIARDVSITLCKPLINDKAKSFRLLSSEQNQVEFHTEMVEGKLNIHILELGMWSLLVIE